MANPVSFRTHGRWGLCLLATGLLALSSAYAGAHKEIGPRVEPEVPDAVRAGVTAIVEETANRWNSQDFATLLGLWDPAEAYPTYLAEEQAEWFVGWDRLRAYLDPPRPIPVIEAIRMFAEDVRVKQIAPDLAIGIWNWHFEMKTIGSKPVGEDVRVSGVFRKTADGWRFIHYAESPKTAAVFLEDLMEKEVRPGWDEFYEQAKQRKREVARRKQQEARQVPAGPAADVVK
jgi:hypothetical protein